MKRALLILSLWLTALPAIAQDSVKRDPHEMHRLHQDPKSYIGALENPKRDAYQRPQEVVTALDIKPGEFIADIGAGSGYFTFRLAKQVGEQGRVYAVDVSPDMIRHINRRARELRTANVTTLLADPDDPLLGNRSVNRFFFSDSWHHIENHSKYLALMKRMLKPDGEVVIIDFHKRDLPVGPPTAMKIAREEVIKELQAAGFTLQKEHSFLPYQYFLVFGMK